MQRCLKRSSRNPPSQQRQHQRMMTNGLSPKFFATEMSRWKASMKSTVTTTTIEICKTLTTCSMTKKLSSTKSLGSMKTWSLSLKKARTVSAFRPMVTIEPLSSMVQSSKSSRMGMTKTSLTAIGLSTWCICQFLRTSEVMWLNQATWCSTIMSQACSLLISTTRTESSISTWTLAKLLMSSSCRANWDKVESQCLSMSSRMRRILPVNLSKESARGTCSQLTLGLILRVESLLRGPTRPTQCSAL